MRGHPHDLRAQLPRLNAWWLCRLLLCFTVCTLAWYALLREPYLDSLAYANIPLVRMTIDTQGLKTLKVTDGTLMVNSGVITSGNQLEIVEVRGLLQRDWSMLILGLLLCLTPGRRLMHFWRWVPIAIVLVWLSQVLTVYLFILEALALLYEQQDKAMMSSRLLGIVTLFRDYLVAARPFLPLLALLPLWLRPLPRRFD